MDTATLGWTAHCTRLGACDSGPGIGGDGGPGGTGGRGADAVPGGPGFDLVIAGSLNFVHLAEQFTILNKGGEPGLPGTAGPNGPPGRRGQGVKPAALVILEVMGLMVRVEEL